MTAAPKPLSGLRILLIEEESFLASYIEAALSEAGAQTLGPARTAGEANALISQLHKRPNAAVVSLRLYGSDERLSAALAQLAIPLLLIHKDVRDESAVHAGHDVLPVPFAAYQVVDHIRGLQTRASQEPQMGSAGPALRGH